MATIIPNTTGAYLVQVSGLGDAEGGPIISKSLVVGWAVPSLSPAEHSGGREQLHRSLDGDEALGFAVPVLWDTPLCCDETWVVSDLGVEGDDITIETFDALVEDVWRRWLCRHPSSPAPQRAPLWVRITRNGQP